MVKHHKQITLGKLIALLNVPRRFNDAVRFDFCSTCPTTLASYRGYYEDLALGWAAQENYPEPTLGTLVEHLKEFIGKKYDGYKGGGPWVASENTPLWVANWSNTGDTVIAGVETTSTAVIILTANTEVE